MVSNAKWDAPEQVESFARRDPDVRLQRLLSETLDPVETRALDLGCAGGRNTVLLVESGCDVHARDASEPMVARTRQRVAEVLGTEEADRRVRIGRMDDLGWADTASFDLVVALGIYHCAESRREWESALAESARVLRPGGLLLVSVFTPETDFSGGRLRPVAGEPDLFEGFSNGLRAILVDAEGLDRAMERHGLVPAVATETVVRTTDTGERHTVNGLYRRVR